MEVNREVLLQQLESVLPGVSKRDIIEQSSCFVFNEGRVITYNDEITCTTACVLPFKGAVSANPLVEILRKLKEETIDIEPGEELVIRGKKRSVGIRMEQEISLPLDHLETPTKWKKLPEEFTEAVTYVKDCASSDQQTAILTCIHIRPDALEASDNYQIARFGLTMPIKNPVLVKQESLRYMTSLDMVQFSETANWIHFRNGSKVILSCRRYEETFPDIQKHLQFEGSRVVLPKSLAEAVERARVFSAETSDDEQIRVSIRPGKFRIRGEGTSGWYSEWTKTEYKGPALSFLISPELLTKLVGRTNECEVGESRLRVKQGKFVYVTALGQETETEQGEE